MTDDQAKKLPRVTPNYLVLKGLVRALLSHFKPPDELQEQVRQIVFLASQL